MAGRLTRILAFYRPHKIVEISGKGKGMVAARDIKAGELVIAEAPAISVLQHGSSINYMDLLRELDALPPEKLVKFLELHNAQKGRMPAMVDIFCTNCIEMGSTNRLGLFFVCSNFNSTCMPNVNNTWYQNPGKVLFHAIRDIKCGEELGFCYVSTLDSRKERRSLLQHRYGFECRCAACVAAPELLEVSEARRSRIAAIEKILDDNGKKAMKNALQNLELVSIDLVQVGHTSEADEAAAGRSTSPSISCLKKSYSLGFPAWPKQAINWLSKPASWKRPRCGPSVPTTTPVWFMAKTAIGFSHSKAMRTSPSDSWWAEMRCLWR